MTTTPKIIKKIAGKITAVTLLLAIGFLAFAPVLSALETKNVKTSKTIKKIANQEIGIIKSFGTKFSNAQAFGSTVSSLNKPVVSFTPSVETSQISEVVSIAPLNVAKTVKVAAPTSSSSASSSASSVSSTASSSNSSSSSSVSSSSSSIASISSSSSASSTPVINTQNVEFVNHMVCALIRDLSDFTCYGIVPEGFDMNNIYHIRVAGDTQSVACKYMINGEGQEVRNFGCDNLPVTHTTQSGWRIIEVSTNNSAFIPSQARVMVEYKN